MKHIQSKEGYVFALKDKSAVYGRNLYLSDLDDESRYEEIAEEEGERLREELESKALEKLGEEGR